MLLKRRKNCPLRSMDSRKVQADMCNFSQSLRLFDRFAGFTIDRPFENLVLFKHRRGLPLPSGILRPSRIQHPRDVTCPKIRFDPGWITYHGSLPLRNGLPFFMARPTCFRCARCGTLNEAFLRNKDIPEFTPSRKAILYL